MPTYQLHGLRIRSGIPLGAAEHQEVVPDLEVWWGEPAAVPDTPPEGTVMASLSLGGRPAYTHTDTGHGFALRFHGLCEFRISVDRRVVCVHLEPGADPGWARLFLAGNVLAFLLTLTGECVLHASAVEVGGRALAFVGAAAFGKSTLAALMCAHGAALITDDVLRLSRATDGWLCAVGSGEIRLRPQSAELGGQRLGALSEPTVDGRVSVRVAALAARPSPLEALVIPRPSRRYNAVRVRRLGPAEALFWLLGYPRVAGVSGGAIMRAQFKAGERVVRTVPVYQAELPWGSPPSPSLAGALMEAVGFAPALAETTA